MDYSYITILFDKESFLRNKKEIVNSFSESLNIEKPHVNDELLHSEKDSMVSLDYCLNDTPREIYLNAWQGGVKQAYDVGPDGFIANLNLLKYFLTNR